MGYPSRCSTRRRRFPSALGFTLRCGSYPSLLGSTPSLLGFTYPSLLGSTPSLLGSTPSLLGSIHSPYPLAVVSSHLIPSASSVWSPPVVSPLLVAVVSGVLLAKPPPHVAHSGNSQA